MILGKDIINTRTIQAFNKYSKLISPDLEYSKAIILSPTTKITIICPIHGYFEQTPFNHTKNGASCPHCYKDSTKKTQADFIKESKEIHGDKYNYSKAVYTGIDNLITIICPIHGEFEITPYAHINRKSQCKHCAKISGASRRKLPLKEFIKRSNIVHNNKFDYSKVVYKNTSTKVKIICPEHGEFEQIPADHMRSIGCKECAVERTSLALRDSQEEFIEKANLVHNNRYTYTNTVYTLNKFQITITCPHHGDFQQMPSDHLQGNGCQQCGNNKKRAKYLNKPTLLYYIYLPKQNLYKIGITLESRGIAKRYNNEKDLEYIVLLEENFLSGKEAYEKEHRILKENSTHKYIGSKFFVKGGESECFTKDVLNLHNKDEDIVKSA